MEAIKLVTLTVITHSTGYYLQHSLGHTKTWWETQWQTGRLQTIKDTVARMLQWDT